MGVGSHQLRVVIYRPPYSTNHRVTLNSFLREFSDYLETVLLSSAPLIITGDFNIHVDDVENHDVICFSDLLESFNLEQF